MRWVSEFTFQQPLLSYLLKSNTSYSLCLGMGKTLQTITTMMDNRPKLQHCKPGTKHPISHDLKERLEEDMKWEKAAEDWKFEMDILKVVKKIRSRDGGGRAGEPRRIAPGESAYIYC